MKHEHITLTVEAKALILINLSNRRVLAPQMHSKAQPPVEVGNFFSQE